MDNNEQQDLTLESILDEFGDENAAPPEPELSPKDRAVAEALAHAQGSQPMRPESRPKKNAKRTKVSFLQSEHSDAEQMPMRVNVPSGQTRPEPPSDPPIRNFSDDSPKIRRMSDSTRAREIEKIKKKNKKNKKANVAPEEQPYAKERPEGDYMYTQIHGAKRAQKRKKVKRTPDLGAAGTETISLNVRDVVSVKQLPEPEPVQPIEVEPAPRAAKTSIDLSNTAVLDPNEIDITIKRSKEEAEALTQKRREIINKMELSTVSDIRGDIAELKSAIGFRIFALAVVFIISGLLVVGTLWNFVWIMEMNAVIAAIIQFLLAAAAAIVCLPVLKNGFRRLLSFQADTDSVAAVAFAGCSAVTLVNAVLSVMQAETLPCYLPCAVLALLLHSVGKMLIISRELTNLKLATSHANCSGVTIVEDEQRADALARGVLGDFPILAAMRHTDSLIDFRKYTYSADLADKFCRIAAPLTTIGALGAAVALTLLKAESVAYGLQLFSMLAVAASCASITFVVNLPLFNATRSMAKNGALLLGYQSVDDFYDTNAMMIDAASLYPEGSVHLAGVKMFSNVNMEETLLAAASLATHAGSVIRTAFGEVLEGKENRLYPVENYVYEDSLGLCGWIHSQRVLLGSRDLMKAHNIEGLPSRAREAEMVGPNQEAVYLSVSGNLSAIFLVELRADRLVKFWTKHCAKRGVCLILRSVDPIITLNRIASTFEIPASMLKIIPARMHKEYDKETAPVENMSASMACTGGFSSLAHLIIGTKVLRRTAMFGIFVQAVAVLLGIGLVLMESILGLGLTPAGMLIFQIVTSLLTILTVNIRRTY
ncbi:MAG: hypothetical protein II916_11005 [Oscillospiraceae bacterium]|nr:hypothetical protein [Oscillospiraceae bacterium]